MEAYAAGALRKKLQQIDTMENEKAGIMPIDTAYDERKYVHCIRLNSQLQHMVKSVIALKAVRNSRQRRDAELIISGEWTADATQRRPMFAELTEHFRMWRAYAQIFSTAADNPSPVNDLRVTHVHGVSWREAARNTHELVIRLGASTRFTDEKAQQLAKVWNCPVNGKPSSARYIPPTTRFAQFWASIPAWPSARTNSASIAMSIVAGLRDSVTAQLDHAIKNSILASNAFDSQEAAWCRYLELMAAAKIVVLQLFPQQTVTQVRQQSNRDDDTSLVHVAFVNLNPEFVFAFALGSKSLQELIALDGAGD